MNVLRLADLVAAGRVRGQRVFIRADLNVPQDDAGHITEDTRIRASVPAIRMALDAGAAVMVTSHLGRPTEGEFRPEDSLAPVAERLSALLARPVPLVSNWVDGVAVQPGQVVLLMVSATLDGDEVKPRIESVEPLDAAAARQKQDMRIFVRDDKPVAALTERLKAQGDARISVVVIVGQGDEEIEVELPGKRLVNPQIAGALRAVPGVVSVELC